MIRELLLWFLIGTFQAETDEEIAYGLVHPLAGWDPIWIQVRINSYLYSRLRDGNGCAARTMEPECLMPSK